MAPNETSADQDAIGPEGLVVPLHEEDLLVGRRQAQSGTVRVRVHTAVRDQVIDEMLSRVRVDVERVPVGRPVESVPEVREEGDTTIIPVVEEVLVVERRLVLKEEIRLHRVRTAEPYRETVGLRVQDAEISREGPNPPASGAAPSPPEDQGQN